MPAHRAQHPLWASGVRKIAAMPPDKLLRVEDIQQVLPIARVTFYRRYFPALRDRRVHGTSLFRAGDLAALLKAEA